MGDLGVDGQVSEFSNAGFFRAAWLIIARGGWWKVSDIVAALPLEIDGWTASALLWAMAHRHQMLATRGHRKDRQYAVTPECRIPKGVTAGDAALALTGMPLDLMRGVAHG
jgi:hypothetical protein